MKATQSERKTPMPNSITHMTSLASKGSGAGLFIAARMRRKSEALKLTPGRIKPPNNLGPESQILISKFYTS